ncbi:uncharacterized protein LOC105172525 isoform X1 [Sesamum indicum]|uniref:Uncharacterized protein LOC105172525 isoform X1 n=1 Tax=Sesamum indicum TaxID=4182 RepID=A0A6I9TY61_SESIN|nr:uncharacterized protein LOC105172525 isoform X1 [Sesamum indicum]
MSGDAAAVPAASTPGSPRDRVKFLCSHGGKILPRPADAHLKYVGGETRVISVPRDIPFQELMKKLTYLIDGEMILKYQVASEDLDALVSVKSDEDLRHMFDEIDRYENAGALRLRAFLFPVNPVVIESQIGSVDPHALEQRYIDAINGIIRMGPYTSKQHPTINAMQQGSFVSSGCSSPRSPDSCTETMTNEVVLQSNYYNSRLNIHKVQSSPSICSLNIPQLNIPHPSNHYAHQLSPQYVQQHTGYQSPKPPIDHQKSVIPERVTSVRSVGRSEGIRYQVDPSIPPFYSNSRQSRGNGFCMQNDECNHFSDRRMIDKTGGQPSSTVSSMASPSHNGMKPCDSTTAGDI